MSNDLPPCLLTLLLSNSKQLLLPANSFMHAAFRPPGRHAPSRVRAAFAPSMWVPPSIVLMLFTNPMIVSLQAGRRVGSRAGRWECSMRSGTAQLGSRCRGRQAGWLAGRRGRAGGGAHLKESPHH